MPGHRQRKQPKEELKRRGEATCVAAAAAAGGAAVLMRNVMQQEGLHCCHEKHSWKKPSWYEQPVAQELYD